MITLTDEYKAVAKEYKKIFGYGVPLRMIPPTTDTNDLISKIKDCINSGKDNLLEAYGISLEETDLV